MSFSKSKKKSCGLMRGGSGYTVNTGSPLLLGPKTGYGSIDPYRPDAIDNGIIKFPPLVSGGGKSRNKKTNKKAKKSIRGSSRFKRSNRYGKHIKRLSRNHKGHTKYNCKIKHRTMKRMRGGGSKMGISFSDFMPSSDSSPLSLSKEGGQLPLSQMYSANLSPLSSNESALANPIPITHLDNCKI